MEPLGLGPLVPRLQDPQQLRGAFAGSVPKKPSGAVGVRSFSVATERRGERLFAKAFAVALLDHLQLVHWGNSFWGLVVRGA